MKNEFEALFENINHNDFRKVLIKKGALLIKEKHLQQRVTLNLPKDKHSLNKWLRIRTDGIKMTMALKMISKNEIDGQYEIEFDVSSFNDAVNLLVAIGAKKKSFQETYREVWKVDGAEIMLDIWPYLPELIEVEATTPKKVEEISIFLGLDWKKARFCTTSTLYSEKYKITEEYFNNKISELKFNSKNLPF